MFITPMTDSITLAIFGMPGGWEWIVVLVIALLIFGKRLPEVGKSLGKGIIEFKKGLQGVEEDIKQVDREVDDSIERQKQAQSETKQIAEGKPQQTISEQKDEAIAERYKDQTHG